MSTVLQDKVLAKRTMKPGWPVRKIAESVGCSVSFAGKTLRESGKPKRKAIRKKVRRRRAKRKASVTTSPRVDATPPSSRAMEVSLTDLLKARKFVAQQFSGDTAAALDAMIGLTILDE